MCVPQELIYLQKVVSGLVLDLYSSILGLEGEEGEYGRSILFHVVQKRGSLVRGITLCLDSRTVLGPGELWPRPAMVILPL